MSVGIIGAGVVGIALGGRLLESGRSIVYGTRDVNSPKIAELLKTQTGAKVESVKEAVNVSDIVILAVPGFRDSTAAQALADSLGPGIANKIVIDATDPVTPSPELEVLWNGTSGGELLQAALPSSPVYKAFNTIGYDILGNPEALGISVTMLFAGPDGPGKDAVAKVIADVGFDPTYVGPIRYARNLEAIAELWIHLGVPHAGFTKVDFGRKFAFNLVKKS